MLFEMALGVVFGVLLVFYARWQGPRRQRVVLAIGLVVTAVLYVLFASTGTASLTWLGVEVLRLLPFTFLAWLGLRTSSAWIALGWFLHVGWDAGLHLGPNAPTFVPAFFPVFCIGFDLVVAGYLAGHAYSSRASRPEAA